jgi:hypothetical protein
MPSSPSFDKNLHSVLSAVQSALPGLRGLARRQAGHLALKCSRMASGDGSEPRAGIRLRPSCTTWLDPTSAQFPRPS